MRSIPLMAATTVILAAAWACGDGGGGPNNNPPVAVFTAPTGCTTTAPCTFTDASTDADQDALTRLWNFGDGATSTDQTVSHQFAEAKTYSVSLTVTDPDGASNSVSHDVVVAPGTSGNTPPTAAFTVPTGCTVNSACPFADASTDPDANIVAWEWNFGDGTAVDPNQNTNHTFGAVGTYQVQLKVTDAAGATNSITQPVVIAAPSASQCTTISTSEVDCALTITSRSSITLTLTDVNCELGGNLVLIPPPNTDVAQNVFTNACSGPEGQQYTLRTEAGATLVLEPGFVLHVRLRRGTGTPAPGSPAGEITGTFPTWTLNFDDGGNPGGLGEPDFGDVVVTVQANPA